MPYTVRQLITKAWYLSGIVSRSFQTVGGQRISDGFDLFNDLLSFESIPGGGMIPYYQEYEFPTVAAQEKYFVPDLLEVETLTFNIDTARFATIKRSRTKYFGEGRIDDVSTLPFNWHAEKVLGGSDIYLYFIPDTTYPIKIWGKFALSEAANLDVDLSLSFDRFYRAYMSYALAQFMCDFQGVTFKSMYVLKQFEARLLNVSPPDLTLQKMSTLTRPTYTNYGDVNLGRGWRP